MAPDRNDAGAFAVDGSADEHAHRDRSRAEDPGARIGPYPHRQEAAVVPDGNPCRTPNKETREPGVGKGQELAHLRIKADDDLLVARSSHQESHVHRNAVEFCPGLGTEIVFVGARAEGQPRVVDGEFRETDFSARGYSAKESDRRQVLDGESEFELVDQYLGLAEGQRQVVGGDDNVEQASRTGSDSAAGFLTVGAPTRYVQGGLELEPVFLATQSELGSDVKARKFIPRHQRISVHLARAQFPVGD